MALGAMMNPMNTAKRTCSSPASISFSELHCLSGSQVYIFDIFDSCGLIAIFEGTRPAETSAASDMMDTLLSLMLITRDAMKKYDDYFTCAYAVSASKKDVDSSP